MKIEGNRFRFLKFFLILEGVTVLFFLGIIVDTSASVWVLIGFIAVSLGCFLFMLAWDRLSYAGHALEFDASGVTEYCAFGLKRHYEWEKYQLRCILSDHGERERFYFTYDSLRGYHFRDVVRLYYPEYRPRNWSGLVSAMGEISVPYTPERYETFRASCPNVRLLRLDSKGCAYYITDSEEEILIAEPKERFGYLKVGYLKFEEFREGVEALAASGFPDVEGILSATGLQLSEEAVAKVDAAAEAEVPAQAAAEEIHASAESASAGEAVEAIRASAAREVEEIRASTARDLEALRASTAAFVDEDSEVDEFAEDEFYEEDAFADESFYEDEETE